MATTASNHSWQVLRIRASETPLGMVQTTGKADRQGLAIPHFPGGRRAPRGVGERSFEHAREDRRVAPSDAVSGALVNWEFDCVADGLYVFIRVDLVDVV